MFGISMRQIFLVLALIALSALASCGKSIGFEDVTVGKSFKEVAREHAEHECFTQESTRFCVISFAGDDVIAYVNSDYVIYKVKVRHLISNITFSQIVQEMKLKYGEKVEINTFDDSPWAKWCVDKSCEKTIFLSYSKILKRKAVVEGEDFIALHVCDAFFKDKEKCEKSSHYMEVTYQDGSITSVWFDKADLHFQKF